MTLGKYYKTASECPLSVFISVLVLDDVRKLKRAGFVPISALSEAYDNIFDDYLKGANEDEYKILLSQLKDLAILKNKTRLTASTLEVLKLKSNSKLVEVLRMLGYRYDFNPKNPKKYAEDLQKVAKDVKRVTDVIKGMEEKFRNKAKSGAKEQDFDGSLAVLGKYQGYRLDKSKISVSEYVNILRNFKRDNQPKNGK